MTAIHDSNYYSYTIFILLLPTTVNLLVTLHEPQDHGRLCEDTLLR